MKVLVTGGTSLLGGAIAQRLQARGDDVTVFQRRPSGLAVHEVLGDVGDRSALDAVVAGAELVIHAAAKVAVVGPWSEYAATNIAGTEHLLDAARRAGVGRFVYVSSPSVAHAGRSLVGAPAGPADPDAAEGNYSRSKAFAERLALAASAPDFPVVAVRPHLVWGPGDTQLVGRIVQRAEAGRLAIVGSGAALMDTTYLDNAADAIVAAADRAGTLGGRAFVISNGQPRPVRELLHRITRAAGLDPPRLRVPVVVASTAGRVVERVWAALDRRDDPPMTRFLAEQLSTAHWFDQRETRRALDWHPEVDLEEGFARLEAWFRDRGARHPLNEPA
ncbi:MAG TPA: NAD-dependent epimerase/dehydratase family protein [Acidimicrobiia bacterium]|nr:NAD-dependent epimerase/dehydratase family protein [Acidimicrobiia bacterium]